MTTSTELRPASRSHDPLSDKMEAVRELLFGEFKRDNDARFALVEARVRELEAGIHRKLDIIQSRIESLAGEVNAAKTEIKSDFATERAASFDQLAASVSDLADRIRVLSRI